MDKHTSDTLVRRPIVERRVGLSRATIYAKMAAGTFPRPVRIGARAVAWRERDLIEWAESLPVTGAGQ